MRSWVGGCLLSVCLRIKQMTELRCCCHDGALGGDNFSGPVHPLTMGFTSVLWRGLHNNEEAGGPQSTGDGLRVWISSGYVERSAMGAAVVVGASQALCPPTRGPSYLTWLVAGGAQAGPRCRQPPYVCVIRTQTSASMQQQARGVQIGIGRSFYEAMQSCIPELRPRRWEAGDQVQRTENCVTFC